ncbi:MAG: hypothetical protein ACYC3L_17400 [Gemmatimonadaceae bacterium]
MLWLRSLSYAMPKESVGLRLLMLAQVRQLLLGLVKSVQQRGEIRFQARRPTREPGGGAAQPEQPRPEE